MWKEQSPDYWKNKLLEHYKMKCFVLVLNFVNLISVTLFMVSSICISCYVPLLASLMQHTRPSVTQFVKTRVRIVPGGHDASEQNAGPFTPNDHILLEHL